MEGSSAAEDEGVDAVLHGLGHVLGVPRLRQPFRIGFRTGEVEPGHLEDAARSKPLAERTHDARQRMKEESQSQSQYGSTVELLNHDEKIYLLISPPPWCPSSTNSPYLNILSMDPYTQYIDPLLSSISSAIGSKTLAEVGLHDLSLLVDLADQGPNLCQVRRGHEIYFVQQNHVCKPAMSEHADGLEEQLID